MLVYTSCTNNYIPKARVLAHSVKKYHPDWEFCLLLGEKEPEGFNLSDEPFDRILYFSDLNIPNFYNWLFRHRVVEICTAAKAPALKYFLEIEKQSRVVYLDPDTCVFNDLSELMSLLDENDIILTPHQIQPAPLDLVGNEICSLQHGIYNLGFFAVKSSTESRKFASWWSDRLYCYCYDDIPQGIFTDQRWIDLVPAFFQKVFILRDPAYNVATWNLYERPLSQTQEGDFLAGGKKLRFYHFTGYDSGAGVKVASYYFDKMPALRTLWNQYNTALEANEQKTYKKYKYTYQSFANGQLITDEMRFLYRNRQDLQNAFPNPIYSDGYLSWYKQNIIDKHDEPQPQGLIHRACRKYKEEGLTACIKAALRKVI